MASQIIFSASFFLSMSSDNSSVSPCPFGLPLGLPLSPGWKPPFPVVFILLSTCLSSRNISITQKGDIPPLRRMGIHRLLVSSRLSVYILMHFCVNGKRPLFRQLRYNHRFLHPRYHALVQRELDSHLSVFNVLYRILQPFVHSLHGR